jgi:hypothetical protein
MCTVWSVLCQDHVSKMYHATAFCPALWDMSGNISSGRPCVNLVLTGLNLNRRWCTSYFVNSRSEVRGLHRRDDNGTSAYAHKKNTWLTASTNSFQIDQRWRSMCLVYAALTLPMLCSSFFFWIQYTPMRVCAAWDINGVWIAWQKALMRAGIPHWKSPKLGNK